VPKIVEFTQLVEDQRISYLPRMYVSSGKWRNKAILGDCEMYVWLTLMPVIPYKFNGAFPTFRAEK
jgi:hypothetical protein